MSGLVKGVKKVFKKVGKFVKKNWKYIAAAVAVYFTAGVALSYFGSTAAFSAAMPGFGAGEIFSQAAVWMGFSGGAGSGIAATAAAKAAGVALTSGMTVAEATAATEAATLAPVAATGTAIEGGTFTAAEFAAAGGKTAAAVAPTAGGTTALTATDALLKSMETTQKLSMIKMGLDTVSGLLAPDEYEQAKKMHALQYASSFGVDRKGNDTFGWGKSNTAAQWGNMNKNVAQNVPAQSQFRDTPFEQTGYEQGGGMQMPQQDQGGGMPEFIPTGQQQGVPA